MRVKGFPDMIRHMKQVKSGDRTTAVPDVCKLGLREYQEYQVDPNIRFGQVVGYRLLFAASNRSRSIPNAILVQELREDFGVHGATDSPHTHYWGLITEDQYEEWVKQHELVPRKDACGELDIEAILRSRSEAANA